MLTPLNSIINLTAIIRRKLENGVGFAEGSIGKVSNQEDSRSIRKFENL